ncbi:unnamed protein product [Cunninghamella blakesleeana]
MISINKIPQTQPLLPTSYSLTNSSLESNRSDISDNDVIIGDQWLVLSKIGEGSFGEVFEVRDIKTGRHYAVKREPRSSNYSQVKHESVFYDILAAGPGIPQCHWYGRHENFDCIIMDLLGVNLKELQQYVKSFPLSIVIDLGCQMIDILEHIHNRGIIYRDVKPENFLFSDACQLLSYDWNDDVMMNNNGSSIQKGKKYESCQEVYDRWRRQHINNNNDNKNSNNPKLYLVDFGLATYWRNLNTKQPYPENKKPIRNKTGTARYASIHIHQGKTPSRRDDMESLGYLLVDLANGGSLPWNGIQARSCKVGWEKIRKIKEEIKTNDLCTGLPREFISFVDYTKQLQFSDQPNYDYLRQLLKKALYSIDDDHDLSINNDSINIKANHYKGDVNNGNNNGIHPYSNSGLYIKNESKQHNKRYLNLNNGYKKESRTDNPTNNNNYYYSNYNKNKYNKPMDDVFIMDDLAQELPIIYDSKRNESNGKYHSSQNNNNISNNNNSNNYNNNNYNNGRRRRNSRKSSWGNGGTKQTSNSKSNNPKLQQNNNKQQNRSLRQNNHNHNGNNNSNMKTNESYFKNHDLVEPWNKYTTVDNQHYHHHHYWQQSSII